MAKPFSFAGSVPPDVGRRWDPLVGGPTPLRDAPWWIKPPNAIDFVAQERTSVTGPLTVVLAQDEVIPPRNVGWIRELTFRVSNLLATSIIEFRLRVNQGIQPGFTLQVHPAPLVLFSASYSDTSTFIPLPEGPTSIQIDVVVADAGTYVVSALARGWFYDGRRDEQYEERG